MKDFVDNVIEVDFDEIEHMIFLWMNLLDWKLIMKM